MERNFMKNRIIELLEDADERTIRLIYRFVCGLVYK